MLSQRSLFIVVALFFCLNICATPQLNKKFVRRKVKLQNTCNLADSYSSKPGFIIVTTNDLVNRLKKLQKYINCKAQFRDFNVFVATEDNYLNSSSETVKNLINKNASFGRVRSAQILFFLKNNYKKLNLKYVLFIGDSHPVLGTVPMAMSGGTLSQSAKVDNYRNAPSNLSYCQLRGNGTPTDYIYVDLDTDWDHDKNGILELKKKSPVTKATTRKPEVFVGRVPYYGEASKYGKAEDVDAILDRFVRYDTEKNVLWRYNFMISQNTKQGKSREGYEKLGLNYSLVGRHNKECVYDFPGLKGRRGGMMNNWEKIVDNPVGVFGEHSHGSAKNMNGLNSVFLAKNAHDKWPTVLTLGACSIGAIEHQENLMFTLLRFQSISASGGTRSVTSYGGNGEYVGKNKLGKQERLLKGESTGEAHWGWYGSLFGNGLVSPTALKINLYGDPSLIPLRYGSTPPYPFFVKPVGGIFKSYVEPSELGKLEYFTVYNKRKTPVEFSISSNQSWLIPATRVLKLAPGKAAKVKFRISSKFPKEDDYIEAKLTFKDRKTDFETVRRIGFYHSTKKILTFADFDTLHGNECITNLVKSSNDRHRMACNSNYYKRKLKAEEPGSQKKEVSTPFVKGRTGNGFTVKEHGLTLSRSVLKKHSGTFSFWIKIDAAAGSQPFFGSQSLNANLILNKGIIQGTIIPVNLGFGQPEPVEFSFKVPIKKEKWHYITADLNQRTGLFSLYVDAIKVGQCEIEVNQVYNLQGLAFANGCNAVVDDLVFSQESLSKDEIESFYHDSYLIPLTPVDKQKRLSNDIVKFSLLKGRKIDDAVIYLLKGNKLIEKIAADKSGNYYARNLLPNTLYSWYIVSAKKRRKSQTFRFITGEQLLANSKFTDNKNIWKKASIYTDKTKGGRKELRFSSSVAATTDVNLQTGHYYEFKGLFFKSNKVHTAKVMASYTSDGVEKVLSSGMVPVTHGGEFKIYFQVPSSCNGKVTLSMLKEMGGARNRTHFKVSEVSLIEIPKSAVNLPPIISKKKEGAVEKIKIGDAGYNINLYSYFKDPEGRALSFRIVSAPRWLIIQGNDLLSPYGPPKERLGETIEAIVDAVDNNGNRARANITLEICR